MAVFLGIPTRGSVHASLLTALQQHGCREFSIVKVMTCGWPLLVYNALWCQALNDRPRVTHFVQLHDDLEIVEPNWLQALYDEFEKSKCDLLSCIIPMKDDRGLTSTAVLHKSTGNMQRLTCREVFRDGVPETFDAEQAGFHDCVMLPNTGLFICDFTKPWVEEFAFSDAMRNLKEGAHWKPQGLSEDWLMGVWMAKRGLKVKVTKKIRLYHHGDFAFPAAPWGKWHTDEEIGHSFEPLTERILARWPGVATDEGLPGNNTGPGADVLPGNPGRMPVASGCPDPQGPRRDDVEVTLESLWARLGRQAVELESLREQNSNQNKTIISLAEQLEAFKAGARAAAVEAHESNGAAERIGSSSGSGQGVEN